MDCLYPESKGTGGYRKGCRCDRCAEAKRACHRRDYAKNKEARKAKVQEYYAEHAEEKRAYGRTHYANNALDYKVRAGVRNHRIREEHKALPEAHQELVNALYRMAKIMGDKHGEQYDIDHIVPVSKGGAHHPENLQILTAKANNKKRAR